MASSGVRPDIRAVKWLPARDVLPREADDFTPWLADNLDLLADAVGLRSLEAVRVESAVDDYRLDILASALDADGTELPVCIENQYGGTNHKHLGQLITYLAKEARGLAIWIVEEASAAHIAAIEFLNRTSDSTVGYVLVRARFTAGAADSYQVNFEVLAKPNSFTKVRTRRVAQGAEPTSPRRNPIRKRFLEEVMELVREPLLAAGFLNMNVYATGSYMWLRLPPDAFIARLNKGYMQLRVNRDDASVNLRVNVFDTQEANSAALDILQEHYASTLPDTLGPDVTLDWHAGQGQESDRLAIIREGAGYEAGDVADIATWLRDAAIRLLHLSREQPIADMEAQVEDRLARAGATPVEVAYRSISRSQ